jgi:hypothetical protein
VEDKKINTLMYFIAASKTFGGSIVDFKKGRKTKTKIS